MNTEENRINSGHQSKGEDFHKEGMITHQGCRSLTRVKAGEMADGS